MAAQRPRRRRGHLLVPLRAADEGVRTNALNRFNQANPNDQIQGTTFQNDAYKTRIRTAVGADQAPTIIWGWGGGTLRSYVQAGQVEDLRRGSTRTRPSRAACSPRRSRPPR